MGRLNAAWHALFSKQPTQTQVRNGSSQTWDELIAQLKAGNAATWSDKGFASIVQKGYMANPLLMRCIKLRADAFGRISYYVVDKASGKAVQPGHELQKKIDQPNRMQSGTTFRIEALTNELLGGENFIRAGVVGTAKKPDVLENIRPDSVIVGKNPNSRLPLNYQITGVDGTPSETIAVDQTSGKSRILHLQQFNPLNHLKGLSPAAVAMQSVDISNQIAYWYKALLDNDARPAGILARKGNPDDDLTAEQVDQIRDQFEELSQLRAPLIGDFEWHEMGATPQAMDHTNADYSNMRKICLALGVPPMLAGIPGDNTYSNYENARLAFYEDTVLPDAYRFADELNRWLVPMFDPQGRLEIRIDEDKITALEPRRVAKLNAIKDLGYISINEKRDSTGWDVRDENYVAKTPYDELYQQAGQIPVGTDYDDGETEDDVEDEVEDQSPAAE